MIFNLVKAIALVAILNTVALASDKIKVVTSLPDFAYLIEQIGQDKVTVRSLLTGAENPHYLDVRPDFISALRGADILCFNGLGLEIGWLPKAVEKSTNQKIRKSQNGYCDMSENIEAIDKHSGPIDRSMGDVHVEGNPHYSISIEQTQKILAYIVAKLSAIKPSERKYFENNARALNAKLLELGTKFKEKVSALGTQKKRNLKFIQYHKEFSYLMLYASIDEGISIEEKPGISPSAARLKYVADYIKNNQVDLIVAADDVPLQTLKKLKEESGLNFVILPRGLNLTKGIDSYDKLYNVFYNKVSVGLSK